ncbi:hypothetical protein D3C80_869340 [compost metagenome]
MGQGLNDSAGHDEVIDAAALADRSDHSARGDVHSVGAGTEGHVAVDPAGAIGGEGQGVIARQVGQRRAGAAVADEVVVAGGRGKCAGCIGGLGPVRT